ncbi:hypothetical protein ACJD0Z_03565 [Flavobacteriaceae bacterium M23B6Z8]
MKKKKVKKLKLDKTKIVSLKIEQTIYGGSNFNTCAYNYCLSEYGHTHDPHECPSQGPTQCNGC